MSRRLRTVPASQAMVMSSVTMIFSIRSMTSWIFPKSGKRQAVEFGRLVDGMSVEAVVLQNVRYI